MRTQNSGSPGKPPNPVTTPPPVPVRHIDRLLAVYDESHRHPLNKLIHWICVPAILWCVLAILYLLPFPQTLRLVPGLDWAVCSVVAVTAYFAVLSMPLAIALAVFSVGGIILAAALDRWGDVPLWQLATTIFVLAWVLQFIGHHIEGRRPSFLQDLRFLLIGPAWLMAAAFRLLGIRY